MRSRWWLGVLARRVGQGEHAEEPPGAVGIARAVGAGDAQGAEAAGGEPVDGLVHGRLDRGGVDAQGQDHLGCALGDPEGVPSAPVTVASVRLCTGSNGWKCGSGSREGVSVGQAGQDGSVDGVVVVGAGGQRGVQDDLLGGDVIDAERLAQGQGVLGEGAGLVRAEHVHTGQFFDGHQVADNHLFLGEQACSDGHGHREHGGHRHRDRGDGEHQGELQGRQDRVAAQDRDDDDHRDQGHREDDEVLPIFSTARWKWLTVCASCTSRAVLPK